MAAIEDYQLIRRIKKGDKQAFESLVEKHYQNIYRYCVRRTGNKVLAADLTQDVFLKLIKSIDYYRFTGKFTNFLFTIAVNTCNDYYKKRKVYYDEIDQLPISDPSPGPAEKVIQKDRFDWVREHVDALPDMQKEAIILYYYHDLKVKDIAKITGVGLPTAKSRLKQAREKLKVWMREDDHFEK